LVDVEVRKLREGEEAAFIVSVRVPFLDPTSDDPADRRDDERWMANLETGRAWVAEVGGRFVGNACIYSMDVTLPAAPSRPSPHARMAGVSAVGVHPTHRRRGLLRHLMAEMFADARQRGEPLAGLLASESVIYGRFGFGHATSAIEVAIDNHRTSYLVPAPELDLRLLDRDDAAKILPELFERVRVSRAGEPSRAAAVWEALLEDPASRRHGAAGLFVAACDGGYVLYRARDENIMRGTRIPVFIEELWGVTPDVEAALWRFVFDLDLVGRVTARRRPVDEPLRWRLADPRQLRIVEQYDRLYVRLLDVPGALEARGYRREGRLVLDVVPPADRLDGQPDAAPGRWVLEGGPDGASCRPARRGESAELRLGVTELGSVYLGGFSPSELARAGRIEELRAGSLDRADALLATTPAPLTVTGF
jgi:predicted acetyltransferase